MNREKFEKAVEINKELQDLIEHRDKVKERTGDEFGFIYVNYNGKDNPVKGTYSLRAKYRQIMIDAYVAELQKEINLLETKFTII